MAEPDLAAVLNEHRGGFERSIGLTFTRATRDDLVCEVPITPELTQPYGLVHGGVYATIVETLASAGAALFAISDGKSSVGLENTTSFVRGARTGKLIASASPVHRGRSSQVWEVAIRDDRGKLVATGRVRTVSLERGTSIAGEPVTLKT
jgi:1,4-dihydroxy-2-naphthoyl-CoA hydrolase